MNMMWTIVSFGKYAGKTLPQILLLDPDWFFWMLPKLYGQLAEEARDLARKATAVKIPGPNRKTRLVEYWYEEGPRFVGFGFVNADSPTDGKWCTRRPHLDLSWVRRDKSYDKRGGRRLIRDFRRNYFGPHTRLTKERCEAFFSDEDNFVKSASRAKAS
jgi:hypothetical protein